ncbi:MAG: hypothetical protein H7319_05995 [Spirosoma sp.]|nr:hypothetical protein [Spirosoma sp.]
MTKPITSVLACAFTIISLIGYIPDVVGQPVSGKVYSVVEKQPEFPGGKAGLSQYLAETIKFPGSLMRQRTDTGPIAAQFIIDQAGTVHDVRVTSKPLVGKARKGMEAFITTVITAVEKMPRWQPGEINDRPVAVFYTLPIEVNVK